MFEDIARQSSHSSGFEREKALHIFSTLKDPRSIPFLLIRLNDWVDLIRELAAEVLYSFLSDTFAQDWIDNLVNLYHLRICGRKNHGAWIQKVEDFLVEEHPSFIVNGLVHQERDVARVCCDLILQHQLMKDFVAASLTHPDSVIRLKGAQRIRFLKNEDEKKVFLGRAIKDKYGPVRRVAFYEFRKMNLSTQILTDFLFDRSPAIRDLAKADLVSRGVDVRLIFDGVLIEGAPNRTLGLAILGIGSGQKADDIHLLLPFLSHLSVIVRRHALSACVLILDREAKELITVALSDKSSGIRKNAARLARKLDTFSTAADLLSIINASPPSFRLCLGIANRFERWERLIFLLDVDAHPQFSEQDSQMSFLSWHRDANASFLDPNARQKKAIREGLRNSPNRRESMSFVLKPYDL